jgi:hypothetical protein
MFTSAAPLAVTAGQKSGDRAEFDQPRSPGQRPTHARLPESRHFLQDDQGPEIARRLNGWMKIKN